MMARHHVMHGRILAFLLSTALVVSGASSPAAAQECYASGERVLLGIDPDVYQMPLLGEYVQSGDELIFATTNWSPLPPEAFGIDFMRFFWLQLDVAQQAEVEATAFFFVTTHWGPPWAPADDLAEVATPADFPGEVFSSLQSRTTHIEFEVPKSDFDSFGWDPTYVPASVPPDPNPEVPWKLRG